ncbi:peptidyl-prolyl isomerase [Cardiosporidium cionae]|uniref:Peptidyl-prolyl isomerase n=1 Tax=Cardiosporidium cionae TaxID=476202 RepID=A0ABQ7J9C6_9APIC|nr:peptidyl-prolyl isomerase [Cardiosporidium cionae]|eukprot:KAF8820255.1 peptidyl-prolyl isomerase [Cardiosporidium cionae]
MCHGGDYIKGNGYGGESIYGQNFRDEGFVYQHSQRGVLSMAKTLHRHSNNSQFFITFDSCPWLDNHHVVFGCLTEGMETLDAIEAQGTPFGRPQRLVSIWNCGEFSAFTLNRIAQNGLEKSNEDPLKENISETMKLPSTTSRPLINEEQFNLLRSREETGLPISLLKGSKFFL